MAEPQRDADGFVIAAGGVVWRHASDGELHVLVVHRPKYMDWTFPKGKLEPTDADIADCARREVREETGYDVGLGAPLPTTTYRDAKSRPKRVHYWAMPVRGGAFVANPEVDEARWLPVVEARAQLTYEHDRHVLDVFAQSVSVAPLADGSALRHLAFTGHGPLFRSAFGLRSSLVHRSRPEPSPGLLTVPPSADFEGDEQREHNHSPPRDRGRRHCQHRPRRRRLRELFELQQQRD